MGSRVDPNKYYLEYNRRGFETWLHYIYDVDIPNFETDKP